MAKNFLKKYYGELSNKELLYSYNKIKKEQNNKKQTGDYGTGAYVSTSEFVGREGRSAINKEVLRRKKLGLLKSSAGKSKPKNSLQGIFGGW